MSQGEIDQVEQAVEESEGKAELREIGSADLRPTADAECIVSDMSSPSSEYSGCAPPMRGGVGMYIEGGGYCSSGFVSGHLRLVSSDCLTAGHGSTTRLHGWKRRRHKRVHCKWNAPLASVWICFGVRKLRLSPFLAVVPGSKLDADGEHPQAVPVGI